jgi:hypothetical protein
MHPERPKQAKEPKYHFVVGVSLTALETALNELDDELELRQVLYAQGTGFVAVMERSPHGEKGEDAGAHRSAHRGKRHDNG